MSFLIEIKNNNYSKYYRISIVTQLVYSYSYRPYICCVNQKYLNNICFYSFIYFYCYSNFN